MADISNKLLGRVGAQKKNVLIWGIVGLLIGGFVLSIYSGIDLAGAIEAANKKPEELPELAEMDNKTLKQESWAIDMENRLDTMQQDQLVAAKQVADNTKSEIVEANKFMLADIQNENKMILSRIDDIKNENRQQAKENSHSFGVPLPGSRKSNKNNNYNDVLLPNMIPSDTKTISRNIPNNSQRNNSSDDEDLLSQMNIVPGAKGSSNSNSNQSQSSDAQKKRQLYYSKGYNNSFGDINKSKKNVNRLADEKASDSFEIVTGFTDAYMVTGAYAPLMVGSSGGQSGSSSSGSTGGQNNVPVLLEAQGDALFPNGSVGSIDKCMLIGTATGNASSATIDIRLDKMTCMVHGGKKVIDGKITGWVVSEVGTPGIPSTMVYRAGSYISRVIASGVLEGLSQGFINATSAYTSGGQSSAGYIYNGATTGASTGVSNAFSKLADFYLGLAEATLPVLEAKGGRHVSIILNGGDKFTVRDINLLDSREVGKYVNKFVGNRKK